MTAIKSLHSRTFERLVEQQRGILTASLADGHMGNYADYKQLVGRLQGLADALKLSEQADFELSGDEPGAGT